MDIPVPSTTVKVAPAAAPAPASTPAWIVDAQGAIALLSQGYAALLPILDAVLKTNLPGAPTATATSSGSGSSGSSTNVGMTIGFAATTDVGAVATAAGKIADALAAHEKLMNTPAMQSASEDAKWQAFLDLINRSEQQGDTKTQEKLQS